MTETTEKVRRPKKFILRRVLVTAMALALAAALAMGANAASGGALYEATLGKLVDVFVFEDGSKFRLYQYQNEQDKYYVVEENDGEGDAAGKNVVVWVEDSRVEFDKQGEDGQTGGLEADAAGEAMAASEVTD